jgi:hypothetical protein
VIKCEERTYSEGERCVVDVKEAVKYREGTRAAGGDCLWYGDEDRKGWGWIWVAGEGRAFWDRCFGVGVWKFGL